MAKVFVCHSSHDKSFARQLSSDLRAFGLDTWFDEVEIRPGDSLIGKIEDGLAAADYLVVILSPGSVQSEWCQRELRSALTFEISSRGMKVIPIIAVHCEIPPFLADKFYVDFTGAYPEALSKLLSAFLDHPAISTHPALAEKWARRFERFTLEDFEEFVARELEQRRKIHILDTFLAMASEEYVSFLLSPAEARMPLTWSRLSLVASAYGCVLQCSSCSRVTIDYERLATRLSEGHSLSMSQDNLRTLLRTFVPDHETVGGDRRHCWRCYGFITTGE